MASARDHHSVEFYNKEEQEFRRFREYQNVGHPATPALAGLGLLPGKTPARDLAHNWIDVESTLLGIGANDLVNPLRSRPSVPDSKGLPVLNLIKAETLEMPEQALPLQNQRLRYYLGGETIQPRYERIKVAAPSTEISRFL